MTSASTSCATLSALLIAGAAACHSLRPSTPNPSGFLGDVSHLQAMQGDSSPELYFARAGVEWTDYDQLLLDPVTIWREHGEPLRMSTEDGQRVADNFAKLLQASLARDYELVNGPGPRTLRVQVAVTEVTKAKPVMNVITSSVPFTHTLGALEGYVGVKPPFSGASQVELRVMDALTSEVLMESVDRRIGTRHIIGAWESWKAVDDAMSFWSAQLRFMLCLERADDDCLEPAARHL
jgi:Protein of unknown function (DUF3313)